MILLVQAVLCFSMVLLTFQDAGQNDDGVKHFDAFAAGLQLLNALAAGLQLIDAFQAFQCLTASSSSMLDGVKLFNA